MGDLLASSETKQGMQKGDRRQDFLRGKRLGDFSVETIWGWDKEGLYIVYGPLTKDCSSNQSAEEREAGRFHHQGQFLLPGLLRPCLESTGDASVCPKPARYIPFARSPQTRHHGGLCPSLTGTIGVTPRRTAAL